MDVQDIELASLCADGICDGVGVTLSFFCFMDVNAVGLAIVAGLTGGGIYVDFIAVDVAAGGCGTANFVTGDVTACVCAALYNITGNATARINITVYIVTGYVAACVNTAVNIIAIDTASCGHVPRYSTTMQIQRTVDV